MTNAREHIASADVAVAEINQLIDAHEKAWNTHDVPALLQVYADDVVFINVLGMKRKGLAEVEQEFNWLHNGIMRKSHYTTREREIQIVAPGVAIAHLSWEMTGAEGLPGWTPPEVRRGLITEVLIETKQGWRVTSFQNTEVVPMPAQAKEA